MLAITSVCDGSSLGNARRKKSVLLKELHNAVGYLLTTGSPFTTVALNSFDERKLSKSAWIRVKISI